MLQSACKAAFLAGTLVAAACFVIISPVWAESNEGAVPVAIAKTEKQDKIPAWFAQYDNIRHQAQMSPEEKERSTTLMTQGMAASIFKSAQGEQDKAAASALLRKMVDRYKRAQAQLAAVPEIAETRKLQRGYLLYFQTAGSLFADYLKIQGNLFATDANGNSIVGQLQRRKADLEVLDTMNKDLDGRIRAKFNVAPYAW